MEDGPNSARAGWRENWRNLQLRRKYPDEQVRTRIITPEKKEYAREARKSVGMRETPQPGWPQTRSGREKESERNDEFINGPEKNERRRK